jgi:hypothetical protein
MATSEYEVVWHGALHRTFPQPTVPSPGKPRVGLVRLDRREMVRDIIGNVWISKIGIAQRAGISKRCTEHHLKHLVPEGEIEVLEVGSTPQGGQPQKLYRRRQGQETV